MIAPTTVLLWDEEESINCQSQSIITNGTGDYVWLSCTHSIGRGRLIWSSDDGDDIPIRIEIDAWNENALEEPQKEKSHFAHISDGDYVILPNNERELWFGLEVGSMPRNETGAIVRYHPDTLDFIGLHEHPTIRTMPWLVFAPTQQEVWTTNWTENYGKLERFDIVTKQWIDPNYTMLDVPQIEFPQSDIPFIQGADILSDTLYLMSDTFQSSLVIVDTSNATSTVMLSVTSVQHIGLGYEREGIAVVKRPNGKMWLLSLGNQWKTWERQHYAVIVAMRLNDNDCQPDGHIPDLTFLSLPQQTTYVILAMGIGCLLGLVAAILCCKSKQPKQPTRPLTAGESYSEVETELTPIS